MHAHTLVGIKHGGVHSDSQRLIHCFCLLQKPEKGRMRVHHLNNVNKALQVLEESYNVSEDTSKLCRLAVDVFCICMCMGMAVLG